MSASIGRSSLKTSTTSPDSPQPVAGQAPRSDRSTDYQMPSSNTLAMGGLLYEATGQLAEFALQTAAAASIQSAGPLLCLRSFTSSIATSAGSLAALPAATLTTLSLDGCWHHWDGGLSKLTGLTNLRHPGLHVGKLDCHPVQDAHHLTAFRRLTKWSCVLLGRDPGSMQQYACSRVHRPQTAGNK